MVDIINITEISFIRPYWLLGLGLIFFIPKLIKNASKQHNNWLKVCQKHLLNHQIAKRTKENIKINFFLITAWILLILALAGFSYQKTGEQFLGSEPPTVIALDMSSSMNTTDENPSRLIKAWFKLNDILEKLNNQEKSLVIFTDEPYAITPLTDDNEIIKNFLPLLHSSIMPSQGKKIDRAIDFSCQLIKQSYASSGNIILLTDNPSDADDDMLDTAQDSYRKGCITSVLALGKEDHSLLQKLAMLGGGVFIEAEDNIDIEQLLSPKKTLLFFKGVKDAITTKETKSKDNGYILIPVILLALLPLFRKDFLGVVVFIAFLGLNKSANAFDYRTLLLSKEQLGIKLIDEGKASISLDYLKNPLLRGKAFYRLQDYNNAILEYSKNHDETYLYNLGNALAWSQKFEEAIAAYDEVISLNPNHSNAIFNRDIIKKLLEDNPPQSKDTNPDENGNGGKDNSSANNNDDKHSGNGGDANGGNNKGNGGSNSSSDNQNQGENGNNGGNSSSGDNSSDNNSENNYNNGNGNGNSDNGGASGGGSSDNSDGGSNNNNNGSGSNNSDNDQKQSNNNNDQEQNKSNDHNSNGGGNSANNNSNNSTSGGSSNQDNKNSKGGASSDQNNNANGNGQNNNQSDSNSNNNQNSGQNDKQQDLSNSTGGDTNNQSDGEGKGGKGDNNTNKTGGNYKESEKPPSEDEQNSKNLLNRIPEDPEALLRHKLKMIHSMKRYQ
ncbi:MAG: VWA domain-containing protein [Alphaproteobacteria bacterium]